MKKIIIISTMCILLSIIIISSSAQLIPLSVKDSKVKDSATNVLSLKDTMLQYKWCKDNSEYNIKYDNKELTTKYKFKDKDCKQFNKDVKD